MPPRRRYSKKLTREELEYEYICLKHGKVHVFGSEAAAREAYAEVYRDRMIAEMRRGGFSWPAWPLLNGFESDPAIVAEAEAQRERCRERRQRIMDLIEGGD